MSIIGARRNTIISCVEGIICLQKQCTQCIYYGAMSLAISRYFFMESKVLYYFNKYLSKRYAMKTCTNTNWALISIENIINSSIKGDFSFSSNTIQSCIDLTNILKDLVEFQPYLKKVNIAFMAWLIPLTF